MKDTEDDNADIYGTYSECGSSHSTNLAAAADFRDETCSSVPFPLF